MDGADASVQTPQRRWHPPPALTDLRAPPAPPLPPPSEHWGKVYALLFGRLAREQALDAADAYAMELGDDVYVHAEIVDGKSIVAKASRVDDDIAVALPLEFVRVADIFAATAAEVNAVGGKPA